ncbi:aldose epimerase family protein [Roseibium sp. RKSG952]|uniref:aldose epimerase family protein n=1 Tax=Roseibium sp. RKSG952 TaxID=2529384 RepID=UPI0012BBB67E|nr:aldose epimerase family protein [Roseibium sp. RKSG952]MTH97497.1 galactose mutarotase [Roseibium sp. RKSG952]
MIREFGLLPDGRPVQEITLKKGPLEARVLTFGAIIRDLRFNGCPVVLGYDTLDAYMADTDHVGAIVGRCANRIAGGKLKIDEQHHQLDLNENGTTHLHGGRGGFSRQIWNLEQSDKASVLLKLVSEDGDQGYPGRIETLVRYTLTGAGALRVKITATTDKTTPVNLTQKCYFNLDQSDTVLGHSLEIAADSYLPVDSDKIPTGEIRNVAWTPLDFQDGRSIGKAGRMADPIDHCFCLAPSRRDAVEFAAALESSGGDSRMEVWTTEPGLQVYDAAGFSNPAIGLAGKPYKAHGGLCLDTQAWPDAVNHAGFPTVLLRPEENYTHATEFRFA